MDSRNYLINEIDSIISSLSVKGINISFKYEHIESLDAHLIEIMPSDLFDSDDLIDFRYDLALNFRKLYPIDDLVFVTDGSLNKISNSTYKASTNIKKIFSFLEDYNYFKPVDLFSSTDKIEKEDLRASLKVNEQKEFISLNTVDVEVAGKNNYALAA